MKYFKYWVEDSFKISIDNRIEKIKVLAGSNISEQAAYQEASAQAKRIEQRIAGGVSKDDYSAAIKEHVAEIIDDSNVITICRYGAIILNTKEYSIFDLDDYPVDFLDLFKSVRKLPKKERIVAKFEQRIQQNPVLGQDFRIYETKKGIRVIGKKFIDPGKKQYSSLMRKLNVDWLYIQLSKKQDCYRARLTPKPFRMKIKTIKIKSPLDCEKQLYLDWAKEYEMESEKYTVVRLLKSVGQDFSNDKVIMKHDQMCNAHKDNKLA